MGMGGKVDHHIVSPRAMADVKGDGLVGAEVDGKCSEEADGDRGCSGA